MVTSNDPEQLKILLEKCTELFTNATVDHEKKQKKKVF